MSVTENAPAESAEVISALAEPLYEHWRTSSGNYELKRQPTYKDATPTLQRVFADQAAALIPVVDSIVGRAVSEATDLRDSTEWTQILDVSIMDADGWSRTDFEKSWAEKIDRAEFERRLARSTSASNADLRNSGWDV